MLHHVKVFHEEGRVFPAHVIVDGEPIKCKRAVFNQGVDEVPELLLVLNSLVDIDSPDTKVLVNIHPGCFDDAMRLVRYELSLHEDFYNQFISSIESGLKDSEINATNIHDIAVNILDRIIGEN